MGYNESYGTVRRMKRHLDELFRRQETVDFSSDEPKSLAYKLREAIHAAQFWDQYEHYHQLKEYFQFEVRPDRVRCRFMSPEPVTISDSQGKTRDEETDKMIVNDVDSLMAVIGAAMEHENESEIFFPSAVLLDPDKSRLHGFAKDSGWKIIDHEEGGVTLTKKEIPEEIQWTP